jgi:hypothetical protein
MILHKSKDHILRPVKKLGKYCLCILIARGAQCFDGMLKSFCMDACQKCSSNVIN